MIMAGKDVRERLSDITQPTLIITSRQDHVVNPEDSDVLADNISGPVERLTRSPGRRWRRPISSSTP